MMIEILRETEKIARALDYGVNRFKQITKYDYGCISF